MARFYLESTDATVYISGASSLLALPSQTYTAVRVVLTGSTATVDLSTLSAATAAKTTIVLTKAGTAYTYTPNAATGMVSVMDGATTVAILPVGSDLKTTTLECTDGLTQVTVNNAGTTATTGPVTPAGNTRHLTAADADSQTLNFSGTVAITALDATSNADLSYITATTVTAAFDHSGTFTGNLGSANVTVASGQTMTLTAAVAAGHTIGGAGRVEITALDATLNADLSRITAATVNAAFDHSGTFTGSLGNAHVTVANGQTMTLIATVASGHIIDGAGTVAVTALDATPNADLSHITAVTVNAAFNNSGTFTGNLGNARVTVASGQTMTLTAAAADGYTIDGAGTVNITALDATTNADLSHITAAITYGAQSLIMSVMNAAAVEAVVGDNGWDWTSDGFIIGDGVGHDNITINHDKIAINHDKIASDSAHMSIDLIGIVQGVAPDSLATGSYN